MDISNRFKERYKILPVENIIKADWNYKQEDKSKAERLVRNLSRNGQVENVIVRRVGEEQWEVTNGNHRLDAFRELGWKEIIAYDMGEVSMEEAQRLTIETNELKFDSNRMELSQILKTIHEQFEDFELTSPFNEAEMASFLSIAESQWSEPLPAEEAPHSEYSDDPLPSAEVEGEQEQSLFVLAGYESAQNRSSISKPVLFFEKKGLLTGEVLDYGAGNDPHEYRKFDPSTQPDYSALAETYDTVMCNNVLDVIPLPHNRYECVVSVLAVTASFGKALFSINTNQEGPLSWDEEQWEAFFTRFGAERIAKTPKAFMAWEIIKKPEELPI